MVLVLLVWAGWLWASKPRPVERPSPATLLWPSGQRRAPGPFGARGAAGRNRIREKAQELATILGKYEKLASHSGPNRIAAQKMQTSRAALRDLDQILRKVENQALDERLQGRATSKAKAK
jgi:hypothetical protein